MYRPVFLFVGLRYLLSRKKDNFARFISVLSMIGILLGTTGLVIVLSVMNGLEREMAEQTLRYLPQIQITNTDHKLPIDPSNEALTQADLLALYPQAMQDRYQLHIVPLVTAQALIQSPEQLSLVQLMGIDPNEKEPIATRLPDELTNLLPENSYNIILGADLARNLNVQIGDSVRILVPEVTIFTPVGRLPSQRLFTISALFYGNRDLTQNQVYLNLKDAQKLLRLSANQISSWRLLTNSPLAVDQIEAIKLPGSLHYEDWRAQKGTLFTAVKMEKKLMSLFISLIVIVAAFNVLTSLTLLIMEKRVEIAVLKTIGLRFKTILLIFLLQGLVIALIGSVFGIGLGLLILHYLSALFELLQINLVLPTLVDWQQIAYLVLFLFFMAIVSTFYPAYQAAKTNPAEALRYE